MIQSVFSEKPYPRLRSTPKKPERLKQLFEEASRKAKEVPRGAFFERWAYVMAMIRLIRASYRGEYRDIFGSIS